MKLTLTKGQIFQIPVLREEGKTRKEIAKILNIKPRTLDYWTRRLKNAGHKFPKPKIIGPKSIDISILQFQENEPTHVELK